MSDAAKSKSDHDEAFIDRLKGILEENRQLKRQVQDKDRQLEEKDRQLNDMKKRRRHQDKDTDVGRRSSEHRGGGDVASTAPAAAQEASTENSAIPEANESAASVVASTTVPPAAVQGASSATIPAAAAAEVKPINGLLPAIDHLEATRGLMPSTVSAYLKIIGRCEPARKLYSLLQCVRPKYDKYMEAIVARDVLEIALKHHRGEKTYNMLKGPIIIPIESLRAIGLKYSTESKQFNADTYKTLVYFHLDDDNNNNGFSRCKKCNPWC